MRIREQPVDAGGKPIDMSTFVRKKFLWSDVFATVALIAAGAFLATMIIGLMFQVTVGQWPYPWWNSTVGILVVAMALGGLFFYMSGRIRAIRRE